MSAIDEVITSLQSTIDGLGDVASAANAAQNAADEGLGHAIAAGGGSTVAGYNVVKEAIERLTQQVAAATEAAEEAVAAAQAIADGT